MVFTQGRGFVLGGSFGFPRRSPRCRVLVCDAADTASLATWVLFGKLISVATLVGFGEKRCRKNLPLHATTVSKVQTAGYGDANKLAALIEPWTGGRAQVMSYSASHDRLEIWLTKPRDAEWIVGSPRDGGVLVLCVLCSEVRFKPVWGPTNITVSGTSRDSDPKPSLLLTDGDFLVRCWDAQVTGPFRGFHEMSSWANDNDASP